MKRTQFVCVACALMIAMSAGAGIFDRSFIDEEGTYLTYYGVRDMSFPEPYLMKTSATIGVVELANPKFRKVKNAAYEPLDFDFSGFGTAFSAVVSRHLAENKISPLIFDIDKSMLIAYDIKTLAEDEGIDFFIGGEIVDAWCDLIPLKLMRVTVPEPTLRLKIKVWMKDATGKEIWSSSFDVETNVPGREKWGEFKKSGDRDAAKEKAAMLSEDEAKLLMMDVYYSDAFSQMATTALNTLIIGAGSDLGDDWPSLIAGFESETQSAAEMTPEVIRLVEYGYIEVKLRGRKWEGEQGLFNIDLEHSKVKNDQISFQFSSDNEVVDEGLIGAYRIDERGSLNKSVFATFDESFELAVPLGQRTLCMFLDQPDIELVDFSNLEKDKEDDGEGTVKKKKPRERKQMTRGIFLKMNRGIETQGVILRDIDVKTDENLTLSIYRNIYVLKEKRNIYTRLILGSGVHYFGAWEALYRDEDPFEFLAGIDWSDPMIAGLIAEKDSDRKKACKAIGSQKYTKAGPALVETLALDPKKDVREEALKALIEIDDPNSVYFMVRTMVWDPKEDVRDRAQKYLIKNNRTDAVPYLEEYYYSPAGTAPGQEKRSVKKPIRKTLKKLTGKEYPKLYSWWG